jgi:hypothetical protein
MISGYRDLPGDTFRTAFFDHAFVTQIGIVSQPLKTPGEILEEVLKQDLNVAL